MILTIETFRGQYPDLPAGFLVRLDTALDRLNRRRKANVTVVAGSYSLVETDEVVLYSGGGGHTFSLPSSSKYEGYIFEVKHSGTAGNLTVDGTSVGQIFNAGGLVNTVVLTIGQGLRLLAGNSSWQVLADV